MFFIRQNEGGVCGFYVYFLISPLMKYSRYKDVNLILLNERRRKMLFYILQKLISVIPQKLWSKLADSYIQKMRKKYLIDIVNEDALEEEISLRKCFNEFKDEIKAIYNSNKGINTLEITSESMETLLKTGYIGRRLESFMFYNQFSQKEINEFYNTECSLMKMEIIGPVTVTASEPTVREIIDSTKSEAVNCFLWYELARLIAMLKEENITLN